MNMRAHLFWFLFVSSLLLTRPITATEDPDDSPGDIDYIHKLKDGREHQYTLVPGSWTFERGKKECTASKGWTMFNLDYLNSEEREDFYASVIFKALKEKTRLAYEGTPLRLREQKQLTLWSPS